MFLPAVDHGTYKSTDLIIDTHCHLDFDSFDGDREKVIHSAKTNGVAAFVNPGVDLASSKRILDHVKNYPGWYAAVGVHPNDGNSWTTSSIEELRQLANDRKVVAVGEIGLDYYWKKVDIRVQHEIFTAQLALAAELDLPVIVHNREATQDVISVLHNWISAIKSQSASEDKPAGVLHSFSGNIEDALRVIQMGFLLGIGGPVTFRNAHTLVEVVRNVPMQHIVVETDAPFLSPHPNRGQRNEPGYVRLVAEKIAEIKRLTYTEVCSQTTENARRLFRRRIKV